MEPLKIEKTQVTPQVEFNEDEGFFSISGRSFPEDAVKFYKPVLEWFRAYSDNPRPLTVLNFELEYFNTASSKIIFEMIHILKVMETDGHKVTVKWGYLEEDEGTLEAGEEYASLIKVPFVFSTYLG